MLKENNHYDNKRSEAEQTILHTFIQVSYNRFSMQLIFRNLIKTKTPKMRPPTASVREVRHCLTACEMLYSCAFGTGKRHITCYIYKVYLKLVFNAVFIVKFH